jgi:hypothetical protein
LVAQHVSRELVRFFHADAPVAEAPFDPFEQLGGIRVVQVDVERIREDELDAAECVALARTLPDAQTARLSPVHRTRVDDRARRVDNLHVVARQIV